MNLIEWFLCCDKSQRRLYEASRFASGIGFRYDTLWDGQNLFSQ